MVSSSGKISQSRYLSIFKMPHPRLTREESQEQTRQRLIAAACKQVAERGFASTTVRDIAREAGYTQGAFYSNFQSKEDLLLDPLRQHKAQEAERITGSVATAGQDFGKAFEALEHWARDFGMDASQALLATELQPRAQSGIRPGLRRADGGPATDLRAIAGTAVRARRPNAARPRRGIGRQPHGPGAQPGHRSCAVWRGVRRRHPDRRAARSVPAPPPA